MEKKQILELISHIMWLLGALLGLVACVCLIIAFAKTEIAEGMVTYYGFFQNGVKSTEIINHNGYVFFELPSRLYNAVGYEAICSFACFLVAKALHWFSSKEE